MKALTKDRDVGAAFMPLRWVLGVMVMLCLAADIPRCFALTGENVLVLVNENSKASVYISYLYRDYHPDIPDHQILELGGLTDCCGQDCTSADEIISRADYEDYIADPVRNYLLDPNHPDRIERIRVIVTTAGMPYRIEDSISQYHDVIYPNGSNPDRVINNEVYVNAASVESELACLWFVDYGVTPLSSQNRMVNPYQGYRNSPITDFQRRETWNTAFTWTAAKSNIPSVSRPRIEGRRYGYGAINRKLNAGDIYLTARLDGPKHEGASATLDVIRSVRAMLHRAYLAETEGIDPLKAVIVLDDALDTPQAPSSFVGDVNNNRTFNLPESCDYQCWNPDCCGPGDVTTLRVADDFFSCFYQCVTDGSDFGLDDFFDNVYPSREINTDPNLYAGLMYPAWETLIILDERPLEPTGMDKIQQASSCFSGRSPEQGVVFYSGYGTNGDESLNSDYLIEAGPNGLAAGALADGAVFTSVESLSAVTLFSNCNSHPVSQGKMIDFIEAGGSGAIGYSFEPQPDAAIDNEFLVYNLFADHDGDSYADMTFVEAAFTAIPYLSWCEVVIGDPLMRIKYDLTGKSAARAWSWLEGDANGDDKVTFSDLWEVQMCLGGRLDDPDKVYLYNDLCDLDKNGKVTFADLWEVNFRIGSVK